MIRTVLTDIEGTTSSIAFVHDMLFPYAYERMADYVHAHAGEPTVAALLDDARALAEKPDASLDDTIAILRQWIREDRKATPLKALQGLMWEEGYRRGDFFGHIYEDAAQQLRHWHERGLTLCVYSSGSVHAQKLLFAHTRFGDLTPLFSGYFDTTVGGKKEADSYRRIAETLEQPPDDILFLSDIPAELEAAREAGMAVVQLVREGTEPAQAFPQAKDFFGITPV